MVAHDDLIIVNVGNVFVVVNVFQEAVINRDRFISPELEVGVTPLIHPHVGQHWIVGLVVRKSNCRHLQKSKSLVVFKNLKGKIVILQQQKGATLFPFLD